MTYRRLGRGEPILRGLTIVEILLAMGLFALVVGGAVGAVVQAFSANRLGEEESYAGLLASEGVEAARAIAARDYSNLANGSHGVSSSGGEWVFSGTSDSFGKFTRTITVSNVYRDGGGDIIASGGTLDLLTKRVKSEVTWNFSPNRNNRSSATMYFTRWTESLCTWGSASQVGELDLPGDGDAKDIDVSNDRAYVTTKRNGSSGEFFILSLSNPAVPSILGEFEVGDHTNAVSVWGNYAFLATSKSGEELIVVDVSNPSAPTQVATRDIPNGVSQANDVFAEGGFVYLVTQSSSTGGELYIYDISDPQNPQLRGNFEVGTHAYGVYVSQSRAYVANANVNKELIVVDVSDPNSPGEIGSYDVPLAGANGQSVFYSGGVVHLTTRNNGGGVSEYYLLEASDPANIALIGSLDVGERTNGVEVGVGFSLLATEKDDEELMITDTSDPSNPTKVFSLDLDGDALGVALEGCSAFFATSENGGEIKVVQP
ncbi:MAG: hypothetical protein BMS9Abin34_311 [Patescibacteria group bacterium]|nr:MAG: hypothetical protein BMS9Abin34_311 [Patescibacteria group bacterium]